MQPTSSAPSAPLQEPHQWEKRCPLCHRIWCLPRYPTCPSPLFCSIILIVGSGVLCLCCCGRLWLRQGGHQVSHGVTGRCNKAIECQGAGWCGMSHGGYCASTHSLLSRCPRCNMHRRGTIGGAGGELSKVGRMSFANANARATTMTSPMATVVAMICTQCSRVWWGHIKDYIIKAVCQYLGDIPNFMGVRPALQD